MKNKERCLLDELDELLKSPALDHFAVVADIPKSKYQTGLATTGHDPIKRKRGRPGSATPKVRQMRDMSPRELARNDLIDRAYSWDSIKASERAERLNLQRFTRVRSPSQHQRDAVQTRAERLTNIDDALSGISSKKSAASAALIMKNRGLFVEVEMDTLRKDIALLRKLARSR